MTVRIALTQLLADHADGEDRHLTEGGTVGEALAHLTARHPGLHRLVWRPGGAFNEQLVAFRNRDNVDDLDGMDTSVTDGDEIMLITAVEGG